MATFDQLPADQRAIIELVLKRGRTYDQLSDMLQMPETRVRELARLALADLSPVTAARVDDEWRDQVADYALGQQSGPESAATRGHLRRSEAARAWLGSIVDSLEQLYADGTQPELPELDGDKPRARDKRGRDAVPGAGGVAAAAKPGGPKPASASKPAPLSTEAREAVQRRRLIGGGAVAALLAILLVILIAKPFSDDSNDSGKKAAKPAADTSQSTTTSSNAQLIGQLALKPIDPKDKDDVGIAQFVSDGKKIQIGVQAKLAPSKDKHAYEVWLYNSKDDAISLGARQAGSDGQLAGANELPAGYEKYKYIDVSDEPINNDKKHSGNSILRGALADIVTPQQEQQGGTGTGTGTTTTP